MTSVIQSQDKVVNENPDYNLPIGGYRKSPKIILVQKHLSSTEKLLYAEILYYYQMSVKRGYQAAIPSQQTLAQNIGVSVNTIRFATQNLQDHGLIEIDTREKVWGFKLQYKIKANPPEIIENYIEYEQKNLKRLINRNSAQDTKAIETKKHLIKTLKSKLPPQSQSYLKNTDPALLEKHRSCVSKSEDPAFLESTDPAFLGEGREVSGSKALDRQKSLRNNKSSINKSNESSVLRQSENPEVSEDTKVSKTDDDFLNSKAEKQKPKPKPITDFSLEGARARARAAMYDDEDPPEIKTPPRKTQAVEKTQEPTDTQDSSSEATQIVEHIDKELRSNGCKCLIPRQIGSFTRQIAVLLKKYDYGLIIETVTDVIENLGQSTQSGLKYISSANYFKSELENRVMDWRFRQASKRRLQSAVIRNAFKGGAENE